MRVEEHKCDFLIKATQLRLASSGWQYIDWVASRKTKTNKQERKKTLQGRGNQKNLHSSLTSTFRHGEDFTGYSDNAVWKFVIVNAKTKEEPASTPTLQENEETPPELIHQSLVFTPLLGLTLISGVFLAALVGTSRPSNECSSSGLPGPLCSTTLVSPLRHQGEPSLSQFPRSMSIWELII